VDFDTTPVARKQSCAGQWDFYKASAGRITEQSTAKWWQVLPAITAYAFGLHYRDSRHGKLWHALARAAPT